MKAVLSTATEPLLFREKNVVWTPFCIIWYTFFHAGFPVLGTIVVPRRERYSMTDSRVSDFVDFSNIVHKPHGMMKMWQWRANNEYSACAISSRC